MARQNLRLKSCIRMLPLVNRWYAWSQLVAPHTFALISRRHHLSMLESFVDAPEDHLEAARNPQLLGGPFIDFDGDPDIVERFRAGTLLRCADSLQLADAIASVWRSLGCVEGGSLADFARDVAPCLQGAIELVYDGAGQASARFIEAALYRSSAYDESLQSCVLEPSTSAGRRFVLSTPVLRIPSNAIDVPLPFKSEAWDALTAAEGRLTSVSEAAALLGVRPAGQDALALLLEPVSPFRYASVVDGVRVRYFGHACVLMESPDCSVLVDPLVSYPGESMLDRFTIDDLPPVIDHVLITHGHQDHLVIETLLRLRSRIRNIVVPRAGGGDVEDISLKQVLQRCGFRAVQELGEYEHMELPGGFVEGLPFFGEHGDLDIRAKLCYAVSLRGRNAVFVADSNPPSPDCYRLVREIVPRLDLLFVGMECVGAPASWLYGPLLRRKLTREEDHARRLNGSDDRTALSLVETLKPERAFVYAMGAEPWITHLSSIVYSEDLPQFQAARRFVAELRQRSLCGEVLFQKKELILPEVAHQ